jgi:anti-sigma factor RsiW
MSQLVETEFQCGNGEALVTYVYGESSPAERDAIAAHLALCEACAEELAAIGSTREQLAAWTPPAATLGFQVMGSDSLVNEAPAGPATVLRPAAWWSRPLPAWAQMAAAVVIFASGLTIGLSRSASPSATAARAAIPVAALPTAAVQPASATRDELARVEQRLTGEIARLRTTAPAADPSAAMMQRVSQMIAASEARQQQELEFRTGQIVRDVANRRQIDMINIERRLGTTAMRVIGNQNDINSLAQRVAYPAASPYVP